jgi:nudix-type nucleoside diphosphatase (YffH/AdpP family)
MNETIKITETKILSNNWYTLKKIAFNFKNKEGHWESHIREVYDRGNGAAILLYNRDSKKVILTKQFRIPTYINGNDNGMLIEVCAGLLDNNQPEVCIIKEAEEETGYRIDKVKKIFEAYMSPGAVTEILYFFIAEYNKDMKVSAGGGLKEEQENIEVLELDFDNAFNMIYNGEIKDAKTIMLLQYAKIHQLFS